MPQLSPMNWSFLCLYMISMSFLFLCFFTPKQIKSSSNKSILLNQIKMKW